MRNPPGVDGTEACDACTIILAKPAECPGVAAHCARGEHCTTIEASCALESSYAFLGPLGDHPSTCCSCKQPLAAPAPVYETCPHCGRTAPNHQFGCALFEAG